MMFSLPVNIRAIRIAFSFASVPELQKNTFVSCAGATDTNFQKIAGTEETTLFRRLRPMNAATVARDGYRGLMKGKPLVISGFRNWLLTESLRLSPRRLVTEVSRKILE